MNRLGRGLNALLPMKAVGTNDQSAGIVDINIDAVNVSSHQARKNFSLQELEELAQSVKQYGVLEPILVSQKPEGSYTLIAGERRLRAARMAGLLKIPAIIKNLAEKEHALIGLIENVQRQDLNPLELAQALDALIRDFELTHEEAAAAIGFSRSRVSNLLRLLTLPDQIKDYLGSGHLNEGQARALLSISDENERFNIARKIAEEQAHFSVRDIERKARTRQKDPNIVVCEEKLQELLKTKIRILHSSKNKSGWISIHYAGLDHFEQIFNHLATTTMPVNDK